MKKCIRKIAFVTIIFLIFFTGIIPTIFAQSTPQVVLFSDDFEKGLAEPWEYDQGWTVDLVDGNHVLHGKEHFVIRLMPNEDLGEIESFESRINLYQGALHINYRINIFGSRYFIGIWNGGLSLSKSVKIQPVPSDGDPFNHIGLISQPLTISYDEWHTLRIVGTGNRIQIYLDDELQIDYTDEQDPYLTGLISFESLEDSEVYIDDVVLYGQPPDAAFSWTFTGGPRGGIGYDVRVDPLDNNIIWVTDANAGAHQSTDGGLTWAAKNDGIDARTGSSGGAIPVFSLTIDPHNPQIIWAGVMGIRGLFKSTDGGQTWVRKDYGIQDQPNMEMRGITVDPVDSNTVYCGGNYLVDEVTQDQRGFIYKTEDGGENWELLIEPDALVRWIIVDPTDAKIIYASTGIFDRFAVNPTGVLKSTDGGQTWFQINSGFNNLVVAALAMDPNDHLTLIAGTGKSPEFLDEPNEINGGVFMTHDGGQNWKQVDPIKASGDYSIRFSAVAFAPSNPDIVYADSESVILRSEDGGETWESYDVSPSLAKGLLEIQGIPIALAVLPTDPDTIFMNAYAGGVFISRDGGKTWQDSSSGYTGEHVYGIAIDPTEPAYVVSGSALGVFVSFNAGETWQGRVSEIQLASIESVAINPRNRNNILIGQTSTGDIYRTQDGGFTWDLVLGPFGDGTLSGRRSIHEIVYCPSAPEIVYAAAGIELSSYVSRNVIGPGVFKSLDEGATWIAINYGLESTTLNIGAIAVHPHNPDIVYLGELNSGIHKTLDGGKTWILANNGLLQTDIRALAIDPENPETIYTGAELGGVWKSENGGDSWRNISSGLSSEGSIRSIVIDLNQPSILYAADIQSGVFRSTDSGATWKQISKGLKVKAILDLAISSDGQTLYAATEGNGVYRLDLGGLPPEVVPEITIDSFLGIEDSPINVDGSKTDWEGRKVVSADQAGDAEGGFIDFTDGYAFYNEKALYFLVETEDPESSYVQFDIILSAGGQTYLCSYVPGSSSCNLWETTNNQDLGQTTFSNFAFGPALEGRIDLRDLGSLENIQLVGINAMVGECCEAQIWRASDTLEIQGVIPSEEESLVNPSPEPETNEKTISPTEQAQGEEEQSIEKKTTISPLLPILGGSFLIILLAGLVWVRKNRQAKKTAK